MIVDDVLAQLPEWRQQAESLMLDIGTITRAAGAPIFDPDTGTYTPGTTTIYGPGVPANSDGRMRLRWPSAAEAEAVFGEQVLTRQRCLIAVPHTVDNAKIGDTIKITTSDDTSALDRDFRIIAIPSRTINPWREYGCEVLE